MPNAIETLDFNDTFLDIEHLKESFPGYEMLSEVDDAKLVPPFRYGIVLILCIVCTQGLANCKSGRILIKRVDYSVKLQLGLINQLISNTKHSYIF